MTPDISAAVSDEPIRFAKRELLSNLKILHLAAGNLYGGVESFLTTIAKSQAYTDDVESHFAVCFPGRLRDELIDSGRPVHNLLPVRLSRPWTAWAARRRIRQLLSEVRPTVVVTHSTWLHTIFGAEIKRSGAASVLFVHGVLSQSHWLDRLSAHIEPDGLVANSRFTAEAAQLLFPNVQFEVAYLPVPEPKAFGSDVRREFRTQFGASEDTSVILTAARFEPGKGHEILLRALSQLPRNLKWACWIAGGPQRPAEQAYYSKIRELGHRLQIADRLTYLGDRNDIPSVMHAADVYCQPNVAPESFGITFVEALYAGVPVVTSEIGGASRSDYHGVWGPNGRW
ncbi:MAG: glycosyltransferase [Pirellulales bacterium]